MTIGSPVAGVMGHRSRAEGDRRRRANSVAPCSATRTIRRTPAVVGVVAAAAAAAALLSPAVAAAVTAAALVPIVYSDLRLGRIPTRVVYAATAAVVVSLAVAALSQGEWGRLALAGTSAAATVVILTAVWQAWPRTLGFGDVRLSGLASLTAGWHGPDVVLAMWWWTLLAAFVGAVVARVRGRRSVPLAPAVAVGWVVALAGAS